MLFQTLDNKGECIGIFANGKLLFGEIPQGLSKTWSYASYLGKDILYASMYCAGRTLDEVCPPSLRSEWDLVTNRLKAFLRSLRIAKINLDEVCFYDLVPERFLMEYCELRNQITEHVLRTYEKPKNYNFLVEMASLIEEIGSAKLDLNFETFRNTLDSQRSAKIYRKLQKCSPYIRYNISGTKTGRLSTKKNSFPILTLDKRHRGVLEPKNDCFVELDFNAAELRTLLALSGYDQPTGDLHEWNAKNVFRGQVTRDEAKKRIFSWLYNPESEDFLASRAYNRERILSKYWDGETIRTCFHREIAADSHHALSYLLQSTCSDMVLRQVIKVRELLRGRRSSVAFIIHDSIVLDFSVEDKPLLDEVVSSFAATDLGVFKVGVQMGKDFGDMRSV